MNKTGLKSQNRPTILSYLAEARAQVEAAQEAIDDDDLLVAADYLNGARALQQETVAALVKECWENILCGARDEDPQRRQEALDNLIQLASALLGSLCPECREKVGLQLQAGVER